MARQIPVKISTALAVKVPGIPITSINRSEMNLEKAMHIMNVRYPNVKISSPTTSLKYTPLQSNIPPSQMAANNTNSPRYKICGSGFPITSLLPDDARSLLSNNLAKNKVAINVITAATSRCMGIGIPNVTASVENPTPVIPPVLQRPWNEPLILRSNSF